MTGLPDFLITSASEDRLSALGLLEALRKAGAYALLAGERRSPAANGAPDALPARYLVVVCSHASLEDIAVSRDINLYVKAGARARILPVQLGGGACESITPAPLRFERGEEDGLLHPLPNPPFAADLRVGRNSDAARNLLAKAGLSPRPAPSHLSGFAQPGRSLISAAAALLLVTAAGGIGYGLWQAGAARDARAQALEADRFTGDMLARLSETLPGAPRDAVFAAIGADVIERLGDMSNRSLGDADLARNARVLHAVGDVRTSQGDFDGAAEAFAAAEAATQTLLARAQNDPQRLFDHSQSVFWRGNNAYARGRLAEAAEAMEDYRAYSERLVALDPGNRAYQTELAFANVNSGVMALNRGYGEEALSGFDTAIALYEGGLLESGAARPANLANARAWRADALRALGRLEAAAAERAAEAEIYQAALEANPQSHVTRRRLAAVWRNEAAMRAELGETERARDLLEEAHDALSELIAAAPEDARTLRQYMAVVRDRAEFALWEGEFVRAKLLIDRARRYRAQGQAGAADDERDLDNATFDLVAARVALASGVLDAALSDAASAVVYFERHVSLGRNYRRHYAADALLIQGETLAAMGRLGEAERAWRAARAHIEAMALPRDRRAEAVLSRILWRLGDREAAQTLRADVIARGFARPDFIAFWNAPDAPVSAQAALSPEEDANDG